VAPGSQRIYDSTDGNYAPGTVLYSPALTRPVADVSAYVRNGKLYAIGGRGNEDNLATAEELTPWAVHTGFYGGSWPAPNRYRASYDFSTLIPQRYYFSVKARNEGGLWSVPGVGSFIASVLCSRVYL
jgi:hypothetical protein